MLYPAMILAGLCIVWGLSEPLVASFMHFNLETNLVGQFLSLETPVFLALLVPTGLIVYLAYYKNSIAIRRIGGGSNPIAKMLNHAYFFDDFYGILVKGLNRVGDFGKLLDVSADKLLSVFAIGTLRNASKVKNASSSSIQNYVAAAVVGFVLIIVLIVLTMHIGV